ncbi:D-alanyl-D-alanine carboxypeptidase [Streptomyces abikoensis]|uniref:D-alanyl-D-alanine carboxypeptidase n=1 Tax=Streptomyces abikoensis TaxID=97398 RepID=UPI00167B103C|nr:D-alanyl-D-alanine carboxypeptidase [Streptomyces abikoensis]GGP66714.1 D-alanyl-D-alanine carboxypeptidase [Streptomyces abikoensis]
MAGESPGKSEQRKSSGETTGTTGTTGSERDPRLGVFRAGTDTTEDRTDGKSGGSDSSDSSGSDSDKDRQGREADTADSAKPVEPAEPAGNGGVKRDARLKAAVAAWVASAEEDAPEAGAEDDAAGEKPSADRADATADAPAGTAADAPAEAARTAKDESGADQATAVFHTVRPKADENSGDAAPEAKKPAAKDEKDGEPAADQATAVFRTVRPKPSATDADEEKNGKDGKDGKDGVDQATAVFGAVRPKADTAAPGAKKPAADGEKDGKGGKDEPAADQATAVFRTVRPKADAPKADAGAPKLDNGDQPTELMKAPTPQPTPGGERKSQFVPLKKDDEAAPAKQAAKAAPAPAKPQPAKPQPESAKPEPGKSKVPPPPGRPAAPAAPAEPAAPLDLLAQLTNTPPPPETPVRMAVRRVKIWTPLVVLLGIIFVVVQSFRPLPDPKLSLGAQKSFTFEGGKAPFVWPDEGQSAAKVVGAGDVGTFGPQKPVPTASVAKVMTAYVILKDHPLQKGDKTSNKIMADEAAEKESNAEGESTAKVKAGQEFSEYDMLRMLLIPSGNNIARLLARWDTNGSEEAFVKKMNDAAKELGMTNTTYTDPSGLTATTKSTAVDQVKLAEVMIKNPVVREITQQPNADIPGGPHINNNNDSLLVKGTGVLGIKTGSSTAAGGALMWAARRVLDGKEYLIVGATMDQHFKGLDPDAANSLTKVKNKSYEQLTSIQNALKTVTVVKKGDVVGHVDDGLGGQTPIVATKDVVAVGWAGFDTKFALSDVGRKIPHSAKAGTEVGELVVGSGPDAVKVPVVLKTALAEPSFGAKLTRLG